jgi:hypothetical protein
MILFIKYVLNYKKNVQRIDQLRGNLQNIGIDPPWKLQMAKNYINCLWNEFRS